MPLKHPLIPGESMKERKRRLNTARKKALREKWAKDPLLSAAKKAKYDVWRVAYYKKNQTHIVALNKKWRHENPEKARLISQRAHRVFKAKHAIPFKALVRGERGRFVSIETGRWSSAVENKSNTPKHARIEREGNKTIHRLLGD